MKNVNVRININKEMGLSSNTLWHQTKKDGLKGIIKNQCLYLSYSLENVTSSRYNTAFAYPMVSVCDLPLAETGNYLKKYGDYTIGFSALWGKRNHFATVWYCDQDSFALRTVVEMLAKKINEFGDKVESDKEYQNIVYLLSYIKQYEGPLPKRKYKKYRFYDERELRFVPDAETLKGVGEKQMLWNYEAYKKAHKDSALLPKRLNIRFEWDDVKYIIVEKDCEKLEFKQLINKQSGRYDLNISYFTNKEVKEDIIGGCHDEQENTQPEIATDKDIDEIFRNAALRYDKDSETLYIEKENH